MNVTKMIHKLLNDYSNTNLQVNSAIKYSFTYNGYQNTIFYSRSDGLQNQLLVLITIDKTDYLTTLYFSRKDNKDFFMNPYLSNELYKCVQFSLLYKDGTCKTTPYFEELQNAILNKTPIASKHRAELSKHNLYHYHEEKNNPFFETIVRRTMSPDMKKKIYAKYDADIAKQIIAYCGNTKTLRFTSDITKSKDIITYITSQ